MLAVKENQPDLYEDIGQAFDEALEHGEAGVDFTECRTEGIGSGRREARTGCAIANPSGLRGLGSWTKLTAICMVVCEREINGICSSEIRYLIGSVAGTAFSISTTTARHATQARFITPKTNSSAISIAQQPRQ